MKKKQKYINRELSWIEFNARVLHEGRRPEVPLLERLTFLGIVSSNFDEFFMVRVAGLKRAKTSNPNWQDIANISVTKQLEKISRRVHELVSLQYKTLHKSILPEMAKEGLRYIPFNTFTSGEKQYLESTFREQILPLLTPLRTDTTRELPHVSNLKLYVAFTLTPIIETSTLPEVFHSHTKQPPLALVQIPTSINRIIWLPTNGNKKRFTLLEDIILQFGTMLFPGYSIDQSLVFRVTNDAAFNVDEDRDADFIEAMKEVLQARKTSFPVRFECTNTSPEIRDLLVSRMNLTAQDVYQVNGILDISSFAKIASIEGYKKLKFAKWKNYQHAQLDKNEPLWDAIKKQDILLHVPYESYNSLLRFLDDAAADPEVLAIKTTLYRTSGDSPIIKSLEKAARNGKQVTVFVELKARFDEQQNIGWSSFLQDAGVIVVHGIANMKVHAKMLLIVRREEESIMRYVHMSTGNFNDTTAKLYVDMSLFTAKSQIANDATLFFNMISGYSTIQPMQHLKIAPINMKSTLLSMIDREAQHATLETPGLIMAKMNSLGDKDIIDALYKASQKNVRVLLNVRGICMLVPGVSGQSENIRVCSIVGRYLEHTRIFYFQNSGNEKIYLSSADWLPRNLERRVELMFPIQQKSVFEEIKRTLELYFSDNCRSHYLTNTGTWIARSPVDTEEPLSAQEFLNTKYKKRHEASNLETRTEFVVRRSEPGES
ncbi:MAG TPA: polyphosphate kinase 1 [Treponemataceae bacterium]|nr:polyphosphate kinase 1 [Treponemataceae bacterium]